MQPDSPGYGKMFISLGDGGNYVQVPDPFNQAQDLQRALGKIFRIDPLKQSNGKPYGIPNDNPFVGKPPALGEIWAYGLRHPQNISFDLGGDGTFMIADIGQEHVEEINIGVKGANYGWPNREGTFVTDRADGRVLYAPPADDTKKGYTPPVAQFDHFENSAVYRSCRGHRRLRLPRHRDAGPARPLPLRRHGHRAESSTFQ